LGSRKEAREALQAVISYFINKLGRINYASYGKSHLLIGSGVTEAVCKSVVKIRLCGPGMQWTRDGSDGVLPLRALSLSSERWAEFWPHVAASGLER
jgi:hypothetical protein